MFFLFPFPLCRSVISVPESFGIQFQLQFFEQLKHCAQLQRGTLYFHNPLTQINRTYPLILLLLLLLHPFSTMTDSDANHNDPSLATDTDAPNGNASQLFALILIYMLQFMHFSFFLIHQRYQRIWFFTKQNCEFNPRSGINTFVRLTACSVY